MKATDLVMAVVGLGVGGLVAMVVLFNVTPEITQTNTAAVTGISGSLLDMTKWLLPVGMVVTIIAGAFAILKTRRK